MNPARITRVFYSLQGEGLFVGYPQVFVRFRGCNLHCDYCDISPATPGEAVDARELLRRVRLLQTRAGILHSVALTGGEPLRQADFLLEFLPRLKEAGFRTYLETNGTLPARLARLAGYLDFIAMDIKLPGAVGRDLWPDHHRFLRVCRQKFASVPLFVKIVLGRTATEDEVLEAARRLAGTGAPAPTLVLQPQVDRRGRPQVSGARAVKLFKLAVCRHPDSRLILPQHQRLGLP